MPKAVNKKLQLKNSYPYQHSANVVIQLHNKQLCIFFLNADGFNVENSSVTGDLSRRHYILPVGFISETNNDPTWIVKREKQPSSKNAQAEMLQVMIRVALYYVLGALRFQIHENFPNAKQLGRINYILRQLTSCNSACHQYGQVNKANNKHANRKIKNKLQQHTYPPKLCLPLHW